MGQAATLLGNSEGIACRLESSLAKSADFPKEEWTRNRSSAKEQRETNGIEYTASVINAGAKFWKDVAQWLISENEGDEKERGCVNVAASIPAKIPTDKQSAVIVNLMRRLDKVGCPYRLKL